MIAVNSQSNPDAIYAELAEMNPEAMVADGFEDCYLGHTLGMGPSLAVYDVEACIQSLANSGPMSREEAIEYLNHNTIYAYVGPNTPIWLVRNAS